MSARGIDNRGEEPELVRRLRVAEDSAAAIFRERSIPEHPNVAVWREAYRAFGAKPKDHPSSIENLIRRVVKGGRIPHVNKLVDLYNGVSLETLLPAGAEDADAIVGDVGLVFAGPEEPPVRLLGEPEPRAPRPGEVIYRDAEGAICRRWNWKEADRTKITEETRNALVVVEALPPIEASAVDAAIEEVARLVRAHCGGDVSTGSLDARRPSFDWPFEGAR